MIIDYKVYERSNVERLSEMPVMLRGESNITILRFELPKSICGYGLEAYFKYIKFENEKGEILRYSLENGEKFNKCYFALTSDVTKNKKVLVQLVLNNPEKSIEWRSMIFELKFESSINAKKEIGG